VFVVDGSVDKLVELQSDTAFTSVVFNAGAYDEYDEFVYGAYTDATGMAAGPFMAKGGADGSDFLIDSIEFEFAPPVMEAPLIGVLVTDQDPTHLG